MMHLKTTTLHKNIIQPFSSEGFSLVELLFALIILSFGLTALMKTHILSASAIQTSQERYHALLMARQLMDQALVTKELNHSSDEIYHNKRFYFVSQHKSRLANEQTQVKIEVRWRQSQLTLSAYVYE